MDDGSKMESPHIIAITELRRHASDVIFGPVAHDIPVFVTQRGYVAVVLISKEVFDRLAKGQQSHGPSSDRQGDETDRVASQGAAGIEAFGPLPRGTLFETPWSLVDAETAAFFMKEGISVRPHRREWIEAGELEAPADEGAR